MLPSAGDIAWVEFDPVLGTEQAGRRPALVVSDVGYHEISSRALVCPITSRSRGWPFEVPIPPGLRIEGVILVDQVRMIHRPSRLFETIGKVPARFSARSEVSSPPSPESDCRHRSCQTTRDHREACALLRPALAYDMARDFPDLDFPRSHGRAAPVRRELEREGLHRPA